MVIYPTAVNLFEIQIPAMRGTKWKKMFSQSEKVLSNTVEATLLACAQKSPILFLTRG